jgi:hypothetical protein
LRTLGTHRFQRAGLVQKCNGFHYVPRQACTLEAMRTVRLKAREIRGVEVPFR